MIRLISASRASPEISTNNCGETRVSDPDPDWIRTIRSVDPDPDPDGQKRPTKEEKNWDFLKVLFFFEV
jgi:hypothetical protein